MMGREWDAVVEGYLAYRKHTQPDCLEKMGVIGGRSMSAEDGAR
jgi:hypothetical protein